MILALWPPALQCQLSALIFVYVLFVLFLLFVIVLFDEPKQKQMRGLVDRKLVQAPQYFFSWPSQAALLFWFFGGFRCGVPLFIVILVIY